MHKIQPNHPDFRFWVNGVDFPIDNNNLVEKITTDYKLKDKLSLISVSRLEPWKRVDRVIEIVHQFCEMHPNYREKLVYLIVGEGVDKPRLEKLVADFKLKDQIKFIGAVSNLEVPSYFKACNVFMSFYDLSNVGNPLLEAMRLQKVIMTLSNGDTSKWIEHKKTGYIYSPKENFYAEASKDLAMLVEESSLMNKLTIELKKFSDKNLWTWQQRFEEEVTVVESKLSC